MRIAVIGSGISGLLAAHRLSALAEVTLFESEPRLGGHTHTVDVRSGDREYAVDTGFIVFNHRTYPIFTRLMDDLGVASRPTTMSFSVRAERTGVEYNGTDLNRLFAQRRNLFRPTFLRMIRHILRFNREALDALERESGDLTLDEFLAERRYSREFVDHYLIPLGASVWSCPPERFRRFPMRFLATFLHNHGMLTVDDRPTWRTIQGGSRSYIEPLCRRFRERIRLDSPVEEVLRYDDHVTVKARGAAAESFDEVVIAAHSDQALAMLGDPSELERDLLSSFEWQANDVVLHTDRALLPRTRRAWAAWNYLVPEEQPERPLVSYSMNLLQGLEAADEFIITLNHTEAIDPERVLRRFVYQHPLYDHAAERARARHGELIRNRRTSFCGAYWGFGFHEDGVRSTEAVLSRFSEVAVS